MTMVSAPAAKTAQGLTRLPFGTDIAEVQRVVGRDGGVVITGVLTRAQVDAVNRELDVKMNPLATGNIGAGEDNFVAAFYGATTKRLLHCLKYSETYRNAFLCNDKVTDYVASLLPGPRGSHSLLSSQGIEIFPGEKAQQLHRDGGGFLEALGANSPKGVEILANTLLALTDITEEMGATRVIPGSHLWSDFTVEATQAQTIPATMSAGDVLLFNGKLLHGGGANVTQNKSRRVISTAWSLPFIIPEEAWPFVLTVDEVRGYPPQLQAALGFHSRSYRGEQPGFLWRVDGLPLEKHLKLA